MGPNRVLYLVTLLLALVFYLASSVWAAWILLVLLAALPWVSLLVSLPAIVCCRVAATLPPITQQGQKTLLHIRVDCPRLLPVPETRLRLNLRTRDREKDIRYLSHLSRTDGILNLPTDTCGYLAPELLKGRIYDYLGLFSFRIKAPQLAPMAILPVSLVPDPMPDLEQFLNQQLKPKPGGGYSEIHDHRPYRPGDPVKGIHWKLSVKTDELIVREPMDSVQQQVVLAVRTPRGPESRSKTLGNLRYLSEWLLDHRVEHALVWMDGEHLQRAQVNDPDTLLAALAGTCLAPESSLDLPKALPYKADWLCRVGQEGGGL